MIFNGPPLYAECAAVSSSLGSFRGVPDSQNQPSHLFYPRTLAACP
jgi:hypothetical protein